MHSIDGTSCAHGLSLARCNHSTIMASRGTKSCMHHQVQRQYTRRPLARRRRCYLYCVAAKIFSCKMSALATTCTVAHVQACSPEWHLQACFTIQCSYSSCSCQLNAFKFMTCLWRQCALPLDKRKSTIGRQHSIT